MKHKVGDRVQVKSLDWYNTSKNKYGVVELIGSNGCGFNFLEEMSAFCGEVMTISNIGSSDCGYYDMKEDNGAYFWTDKMFEGLAQEYPKIAIQGDPAKGVSVIDALVALGGENEKDVIASTKHACYFIDHDGKIRSRLLENIPEGFKLYTLDQWEKQIAGKIKVGDVFYSKYLKENVLVKGICNGGFYLVESNKDGTSWKVDSDDLEVVKDKPAVDAKEVQKVLEEINDMEKNELLLGMVKTAKGQELIPHKDYEIKQDNEKFYLVKKKKEYPKTYEECYRIMDIDTGFLFTSYNLDFWKGHLLTSFQKLLICRNAYWKLYGEEMGLGKPWEPDWTDLDQWKYCIWVDVGEFITMTNVRGQHILAFPTEEMRDAFKENFDPDIEICKEFL